jgi:hypothetical protein
VRIVVAGGDPPPAVAAQLHGGAGGRVDCAGGNCDHTQSKKKRDVETLISQFSGNKIKNIRL